MLLQSIALAWLAGATLAALGGSVVMAPLAALLALTWGHHRTWLPRLILAIVLAAVAIGGNRWYSSHRPSARLDDVSHFIGAGPTRVMGTVRGDVEERQQASLLRLEVSFVEDDRGRHPATGVLLLRLAKSARYDDGDRIEARGRLAAPKELTGFDYADYLARQGIFAEIDYPTTRRIAAAGEAPWRKALAEVPFLPAGLRSALAGATGSPCALSATRLRQCLVASLGARLPEPEASVASDITFGTRHVYDPGFERALAQTGTAPMVVATGFNVTMLAVVGLASFSWLIGRRWALLLTLFLVGGYSVFIGLTPSVLRAALMAAIVVGAGLSGRPHGGLRALILAAALMVLISPLALNDLSFPLSLASTAGLFVFAEPLGRALRGLARAPAGGPAKRAWLGQILDSGALTISASLAALPILMLVFRNVSLPSLPANLVLFPMVPWVMGISAATAIAGLLARPLGLLLAPLAYVVLHAAVLVIVFCARLPGAQIPVGSAPVIGVLLVAVVVLALSDVSPAGPALRVHLHRAWDALPSGFAGLITRLRAARRDTTAGEAAHGDARAIAPGAAAWLLGLGLAAGTVAWFMTFAWAAPVRVTFLDVGAGSAILVESRGSRILVDGGPAGGGTLRALDAQLNPWERSLNLVVVANASPEHIGGLAEILAHYRVDALVDAAAAPANPAAEQALLRAANSSRIERLPAGALVMKVGDATLSVESAPASANKGKPPQAATVEMTVGQRRFILAGDAPGLAAADVRVLSAAAETIPVSAPRIEVLEAGGPAASARDLAGVPVELRRALLYRTTENGRITIETDGDRGVSVQVDRGPRLGLFGPQP